MQHSKTTIVAVLLGGAVLCSGAVLAQIAGGTMTGATPNSGDVVQRGNLSPDQQKLQEDTYSRTKHGKNGLTKAQVLSQASDAFSKLQLSCTVSDAAFLGESTGADGASKVYEAACDSGLGYFVVSSEKNSSAFTCFAADATRARDEAAGRQPGPVCSLPDNKDLKVMAHTMLGKLGTKCQVKDVRWIGVSARANSEYTEVACNDGTGYVLTMAVPGSHDPVSAITCIDAAKRGIMCKLSPTGQPAITLQTFRDELAKHKIVCTADDKNVRHIGQENNFKRHVVEFKCAERPKGLVAYIPLSDSSAPFEIFDCTTAAQRGAICKLQ